MDQSKPLLVAIVQDEAPSRTPLGRLLAAAPRCSGSLPTGYPLIATIVSITNPCPDGG
jgi:hypothetical protein